MATDATFATGGPRYLAASEVAARWAITPRTVQRLVARGELPGLRVGRVLRIALDDVVAFEQQQRSRQGDAA